MVWRCNGILNLRTGIRCCQGTMVSPRLNSFFTHRSLNPSTVLEILFYWLCRLRRMQIAKTVGVSPKAVTLVLNDWYQLLQEDLKKEDVQIGGVDPDGNPIVVEIDESKFGKRKGGRGHCVDGVWVVDGVEKTPQRKCFLMVVENRDMRTINAIIERFVLPGSIVRADSWRAYN
ncbi:hypothetical protein RMATCC62417_14128 [Rhizopus microsporus]|nr:hypothetical protein RMATCC62417_14128 [Rhizopus microsporus]